MCDEDGSGMPRSPALEQDDATLLENIAQALGRHKDRMRAYRSGSSFAPVLEGRSELERGLGRADEIIIESMLDPLGEYRDLPSHLHLILL